MNRSGYEECVKQCVIDPSMFTLVVKSLMDADDAKDLLRSKGYGVTGMGILEAAKEVESQTE